MNVLHAIVFGIVEGVTEFLPVSSTGHLILVTKLLRCPQTEFVKSFEIAIQLGAISAVILLYRRTLLKRSRLVWRHVLVAFLPTACIGLAFYKLIKKFLLGNDTVVLYSLFLGGIFLVAFELLYKKKKGASDAMSSISYKQSFYIGLFQSLAVIPGVSRIAATIIGGLFLGLKRKAIIEFSFLLAIPTMLAAAALDFVKSHNTITAHQFFLLGIGFWVSFLVAIFTIKFLLYFIKKNNFVVFGIYRIAVAVLFWLFLR